VKDSVSGGKAGIVKQVRVRGGRGLGDSLYVRPIVDELVRRGDAVTVLTDYPHVFLGSGAKMRPFERIRVDVTAHYVGGKRNPKTTQWEDVCESANVRVPLRFKWRTMNPSLIKGFRAEAADRPIVLVHGGRLPMERTDGFGIELLPKKEAFDIVMNELKKCFVIQIGNSSQIYQIRANVNLNGKTSVADVLDLGAECDAVIAQCSFAVPLAEVFGKPLLAIWGSKISSSREAFVRCTTPLKVLSSVNDYFVMDDWPETLIADSARSFLSVFSSLGNDRRQMERVANV
jgi:hypothetical protein